MAERDNPFEIRDGTYEIAYREDGVFLIVNRHLGKGKPVNETEVLDDIRRKRIKSFNASDVSSAVMDGSGEPVKIAESQQIEKIDSEIIVITSPDKMKAFVNIKPPAGGGKTAGYNGIVSKLKEVGVVFGYKEDILKSLNDYPMFNQNICVAEGNPPINGKNGEIKFLVDVKKDRKPIILEDGSVNYRELDLIENVHKGQKMIETIPPTFGIPGTNIMGKELKPLDGKPAKLAKGRNVFVHEESQSMFAEIDGQVQFHDGKIGVFATYEVPDDVDNSTGNIKFVGNVNIRGSVLSGFSIEAGGNVEVSGVVEGAVIKAEGDIILRRGMHGGNKGQLIAGGDIVSKYIESSTVEAKHDIRSEAIMHSEVRCGNKLELGGRKGLLVGGTARVGKEIEAKFVGNNMATVTNIEVGVDPNLRERYRFLRTELIQLDESIKKTTQAVTLLKRFESAGMLSEEKKEMLTRSIRSKIYFESKKQEYKEELVKLEERLKQEASGTVKVLDTIFNGTRVTIGTATMYVKESLQYCMLYKDGVDIRIGRL